MPTSAEMNATISSTTMLAMSLPLAMRSDWYGCVKKKSKHSAAAMADSAPGQRPPITAAMSTGTTSAKRHVVVVQVAAQREHRDRERQRAEHPDREADEVRAVFGLAAGVDAARPRRALSSYGRGRG